ncbi:MAG: GNAT family N-acetyltransferase [Candidatus Riflebacteria bacterium GWC2_50_8]|nr:MAG: GNAT family N-acetyltransferase [Candidatus Riflebacteria bacterium GWC2_50_8]
MPDLITIETDRLLLRQWRAEDRLPFSEMNADPEVMKYFPTLLTREQSDLLADRCQAFIEEHGWGLWAVETRTEGLFIGFVGLSIPVADLPFNPCVEIGWRLSRLAWGKGYATEAARAALRLGFETLHLSDIVSFTSVINVKSRAVMERLGMIPDSSTFEHPRVPPGNSLREHCLYRISYQQWIAGKS